MKTKITFFCVLIAISFASKAQTNVSGGIYSNTTWTLANSPYIVIDTVVVFPGITLTIQPGVTIKFDNNMRLEIRQAKLVAIGTSTDSINFTSSSLSPTPGIWSDIFLNGGAGTDLLKFNYCNFRYANIALNGDNSNSHYSFLIKNSNFIYNKTGLTSASCSSALIDSCNFINNVDYGIIGIQSSILKGCNFLNNEIGMSQSGFYNVTNNCNFYYNQYGITNLGVSTVEYCTFKHNQQGLIVGSYAGSLATVKNCIIDSNNVVGISINSGDTIVNNKIRYNHFGLTDSMNVYPTDNIITKNIIENNDVGIKFSNSLNQLYCNKICNNASYNLHYNAAFSSNINSTNNYWGTTDSSIISTKIYDGYDNINLGLASFMPIDTSQCYINGCNLSLSTQINNSTCDTCHNGSATAYVTNGFAPYIFTWYSSPIQTTPTAIGLTSGTYTVCVTDANGCNVCINNVFVDSTNCNSFAITTNATNATCNTCNDGSTLVTATGGTSPYQYTWYTSPMQSTSIATGLSDGTYNVCVTDAYGCSACDSTTIFTGNCSAHFNLYPDSLPHNYLAINMASGAQPLTYSWDWGDGNNSNTPYPNHTYSSPGFYTICLTITDAVGCTNTYCTSYYLQKSANSMVNISVIPSIINEITENTKEETMLIFPNPACDYINFKVNNIDPTSEVKIFNLLGEIKYFSILREKNDVINISDLSSGIYLIEVARGSNISRQKFIKQ